MKRMSLIMAICCLVFIGSVFVYAGPGIEFIDGIAVDFGTVKPNTALSHTFVFINPGDSVLNIEQVKGG